jgi:transposase
MRFRTRGGNWASGAAQLHQHRRRRWVVERTFGWLGRWRRTSKDYDYLQATSACVISLTMIRAMLRRLAQS